MDALEGCFVVLGGCESERYDTVVLFPFHCEAVTRQVVCRMKFSDVLPQDVAYLSERCGCCDYLGCTDGLAHHPPCNDSRRQMAFSWGVTRWYGCSFVIPHRHENFSLFTPQSFFQPEFNEPDRVSQILCPRIIFNSSQKLVNGLPFLNRKFR